MTGALPNARVSVIIPVHDGEAYLAQAIDSVLAQTEPPDEVVVVDDGSRDGSAAIADAYGPPVARVWREQAGAAAAVNLGVARSSGELLAFLDADDLWLPGKLALQRRLIEERPEVDLVFAHVQQFREGRDEPRETLPGYSTGTLFLARAAWERVGPLATDLRVGEFLDWLARARDLGLTSHLLPEVLMRRRIHGRNTGVVRRGDRGDYARVVKRALDRRRA